MFKRKFAHIAALAAFAAALQFQAGTSRAIAEPAQADTAVIDEAGGADTLTVPPAIIVSEDVLTTDTSAIAPDTSDEAEPAADAPETLRKIGMVRASYYAKRFHGKRTASGEMFDMNAMTAAHRSLPFGTKLRVTNPANGRSVIVRVNDRGPFGGKSSIDLSPAAARVVGIITQGHGNVMLEEVA